MYAFLAWLTGPQDLQEPINPILSYPNKPKRETPKRQLCPSHVTGMCHHCYFCLFGLKDTSYASN